MKKIRMMFQGNILTFRVTYECEMYMFCECDTKPEARGFFTKMYVALNKQ